MTAAAGFCQQVLEVRVSSTDCTYVVCTASCCPSVVWDCWPVLHDARPWPQPASVSVLAIMHCF